MDSNDSKGAYSRTSIFKGENYAYQKDNMYVHLVSIDKMLWVAITDEPLILKNKVDDYGKLTKDWSDDETKKASQDLKTLNILISMLSTKVYYFISHHKSAQSLWNAL